MGLDSRNDDEPDTAQASLTRRIAFGRFRAGLMLLLEQALPLLVLPLSLASLFLSAAWFGVFRALPDPLRWLVLFLLTFAFLASLLPLTGLRWPKRAAADARLEAVNRLPYQAIAVQEDEPVTDTPFARALWDRHRKRMASTIVALDAGLPRPDISRFDATGLRTVPALVFTIALAYSLSGASGSVTDAFRNHQDGRQEAGLRADVWVTPPGYTGKPALTLSAEGKQPPVPQFSTLTVRLSGSGDPGPVTFSAGPDGKAVTLKPDAPKSTEAGAENAAARSFSLRLETDGKLAVDGRIYTLALIPDAAPRIVFDGKPRRTVNGALEIRFKASDDYGLKSARADIVPLDQPPQAEPLFPLPEFPLDLARGQGREVTGLSSRNLTEHPLAGKRVRISLVAEDGAGQTGRSPPIDMVMPARSFSEPLAAAVAEQRQIFSLDTRDIQKAIDYNDAITLRADETIPNATHYLLIKSARSRMALARTEDQLKDAAAYLWQIALGIDGGELPMAEQALRDAQKALSEALKRNAPDKEIQALMDNLRKAMKDYMAAMAKRMQQARPGEQQGEARNVIRQQDLERMMDQLENMARSGNKEAAEQLLSEMQKMMNNLQAGPSQRQPSEADNKAREQVEKLGKILSDQQKLMEETYKLNKEMEAQQWQDNSGLPPEDGAGEESVPQPGDEGQPPGGDPQAGEQQDGQPPGAPTRKQREAMESLQKRQQALQQQLDELGKGMKGLGLKPGKGLGQAGREMNGAAGSLGRGEGQPAIEGQGRAIEALRQGAREMMQAMRGKGEGNQPGGPGMGSEQSGRDPLGRSRGQDGMGDYSDGKVPDEVDVQRARDILEEIRRKLGESGIAPTSRQYLERLLNLN